MDATIEVVLKQMVLLYEKLFFFSIALFFVGLVVLLVKNKKRFIFLLLLYVVHAFALFIISICLCLSNVDPDKILLQGGLNWSIKEVVMYNFIVLVWTLLITVGVKKLIDYLYDLSLK